MEERDTKSKFVQSSNGHSEKMERVSVDKTFKLYIGGAFPRTESGRYSRLELNNGNIVNICTGSRKDFRNAVVAARKAQDGWSSRTAYNRGQVIYRIAEMLEARRAQFLDLLAIQGSFEPQLEIDTAIDRIVYYAGWADKFQQIFSTVNPVAGSYFNFSVPEPSGVIAMICPGHSQLTSLISNVLPAIVGGNSVVALVPPESGPVAITLAEVLHTSDLPGGVINILTGVEEELGPHMARHMDVNGFVYASDSDEVYRIVQMEASENVKRTIRRQFENWADPSVEGPYAILDMLEIKTTWHPIGQ